jgi:peptidoglycan/LPS O-acetylase OafA/YrhL
MLEKKYLKDILQRGGNNFDLFRLIAALLVMIGHAYSIAPEPPLQDGINSLLRFDYSGSLAVKFFFFLSGILVTNSIIAKPNAFLFLLKRIFRILPGLLVCLLVAVFIIGPVFTTFPLGRYFAAPETWSYLYGNFFLLDLQWKLTGVFSTHPHGLNGSLWTLPSEMACYIYLAIFHGLGLLKKRNIASAFYVAMIIVPYVFPTFLPRSFQNADYTRPFISFFSLGALCATNKDIIEISFPKVLLLWLLSYSLWDTNAAQHIFYIALFYTVFFVSSLPLVIRYLRLPFDASFGVYVYGFMVQQCVFAVWPHLGVHGNQAVSMAIVLPIGIISWYLVEKPAITLGHRISERFTTAATRKKAAHTETQSYGAPSQEQLI